MKNPKNWTPEEFRSWHTARVARERELREHVRRIEAEIAGRKRRQAE
jgi:hypothetical protein